MLWLKNPSPVSLVDRCCVSRVGKREQTRWVVCSAMEGMVPTRDSPSRGFFTWREDMARINEHLAQHDTSMEALSNRVGDAEGT